LPSQTVLPPSHLPLPAHHHFHTAHKAHKHITGPETFRGIRSKHLVLGILQEDQAARNIHSTKTCQHGCKVGGKNGRTVCFLRIKECSDAE